MNELNLLLTLIIILSLLLNIFFIVFDGVIPAFTKRLIKQNYFYPSEDTQKIEDTIVEASYDMFLSRNLSMPWQTDSDFLSRLRKIKNQYNDDVRVYNYPKAYLSLGLIQYASKKDKALLDKVKVQFDNFYVKNDGAKFELRRVDQVPIGQAALILYDSYKEEKYKILAEQIYKYIKTQVVTFNDHDVVLYRYNQKLMFVDVVGMIVPFLVEYSKIFNEPDAANLAESEIMFYIKYGIDNDTFLPYHAINLSNNESFGPNNWGRGIGWFILGLESVYNYSLEKKIHNPQLIDFTKSFLESINRLKFDEIYTQFPGTSVRFDSSSTTMLFYGTNKIDVQKKNKHEILQLLAQYIKDSGRIDLCSGDTYDVNLYSRQFGVSELSQGLLLMLLSTEV